MVRIKHRYLLFNILYPSPSAPAPSTSSATSAAPPPLASSLTVKDAATPPPPPYILFLRPSPNHLTPALLVTHLRSQIQTLFGDHGVSVTQSSLRLVYFSPATSTGILRVPRAHFRLVWASLTFLTSVPAPSSLPAPHPSPAGGPRAGGKRGRGGTGDAAATAVWGRQEVACVVRVVRVSGTIKKSEEELLRRARREVVRAKLQGRSVGDQEDDAVLKGLFAGENGKTAAKGKGKADGLGLMGEESILDLDEEDEEDFENDSG
ncbi:uncharacterized protein Z519_01719 [Cladophialophora bantiana CBS 173.52]|uniref:Uncharacterized protein n=1 Tax=Cladophialophora bantiana (strain ATCC 10958 / CBS 173.52 / CDC B-1940 / NIH 8579) TaxID=1442370 RepID=A0A0D2I4F6_CLAB1|nr:uncharacterized protein Z519_01719 [Cladophialophora bantiana CBS 173.52]KIW98135.1 hypothetical protein Z519_01719 [Cladophialophora bantiana CBS 173.52]